MKSSTYLFLFYAFAYVAFMTVFYISMKIQNR